MSDLVVMIGLSGCGKSFQANKLNREKYNYKAQVISTDKIREELYGDESVQGSANLVFEVAHKKTIEALLNDVHVIFDATNLRHTFRKDLLDKVPAGCRKIALVVAVPFIRCLKNNGDRDRKVPEHVIRKQILDFQFPCYWEGFDLIVVERPFGYDDTLLPLEAMDDFDQENSHHSLPLGAHVSQSAEYIAGKTGQRYHSLFFAACLHDYGKLYTKNFIDYKGNPSNEAHYYGHPNAGAYNIMMHPDLTVSNDYKVLQLITHHMEPYFWKKPATVEKYHKLYGEEFFNEIILLHEADEAAH